MIGDFSREQEKFVSEHHEKKKQSEAAVPPWVGYNEEETMKTQILALSKVMLKAIDSSVGPFTECAKKSWSALK